MKKVVAKKSINSKDKFSNPTKLRVAKKDKGRKLSSDPDPFEVGYDTKGT